MRLMKSDWSSPDSALRLNGKLELGDVATTRTFANARTLLRYEREHDSLAATDRGNLKVNAVNDLLDRMAFETDYVDDYRAVTKRAIEEDVPPLHNLRVVCELAGLLRRYRKRFTITKAARGLMDDDARAGELYELLFRTWFRKFDIQYGGSIEWPELQHQLAYTLYRLPVVAADWCLAENLLEHVVLPFALQQAPRSPSIYYNPADTALHHMVLTPLVDFGLLESTPERRTAMTVAPTEFRTTPLYARFIHFDI
jgi:hypothetical protein